MGGVTRFQCLPPWSPEQQISCSRASARSFGSSRHAPDTPPNRSPARWVPCDLKVSGFGCGKLRQLTLNCAPFKFLMMMTRPAARGIIWDQKPLPCFQKLLKSTLRNVMTGDDIRKVAEWRVLLFQGLLFLTCSAASRHRPSLTAWLQLTSVCLIYAKVKRHFTAAPVEVKPRAVPPVPLLQAGKMVLSSGGVILAKISFSFGGSAHKAPIQSHLSREA